MTDILVLIVKIKLFESINNHLHAPTSPAAVDGPEVEMPLEKKEPRQQVFPAETPALREESRSRISQELKQ